MQISEEHNRLMGRVDVEKNAGSSDRWKWTRIARWQYYETGRQIGIRLGS
jgi:hypothetical protein